MPRTLMNTLVAMVVLAATHAEALGLGEITLESALNQPLMARIQLSDTAGMAAEDISVRIASARDFERFSLDRPYFLDNIRLAVESNGSDHFISVTSSDPVREPYLAFVLDTRWPNGRILTEYTILLDPPAFAGQPVQQQPQPPVRTVDETASVEMSEPDRAIDTPAPRQTFADTTGTVTVSDTDTLWEIALRVRPDSSVSVQQTMLALQRANPDAFISDNINLVRRGEILRIPAASEMRSLSSPDAIAEVGRQNQLFASRQAAPAAGEPLAAPPTGTTAAADTQGELRVVTAEDTTDQAAAAAPVTAGERAELDSEIADLENRLAVSLEELDRVNRENAELNERLSMLQEQIDSAQELLRLRDLELAQLQQALAMETGDLAAGGEASPSSSPPPTVTMAPEAGAIERTLNSVLNNPMMLGLVLAVLVALLVLLLLRRNRVKQAALADEHDEGITDFAARDEDRAAFAAAGLASNGVAAVASVSESDDQAAVAQDGLADDPDDDLEDAYETESAEEDPPGSDRESAFDVSWETDSKSDENDHKYNELEDYDDIELELDMEAVSEVDDNRELQTEATDTDQDSNEIDFDFDLDLDLDDDVASDYDSLLEGTAAVSATEAAEDHAPAASEDTETEDTEIDDSDFSFDIEDFDLDRNETTQDRQDKSVAADIDDGGVEQRGVPSDEPADKPVHETDVLDDLEFTGTSSVESPDLAGDFDDEDDFQFLSGSDEAGTKLDLARAYIDMDDIEGAREILEEVLDEGAEAQVEQARELLGRLG